MTTIKTHIADDTNTYEIIVAVSCTAELAEAFKDTPIATELAKGKIRGYGGGKVAVMHISRMEAEAIAVHMEGIGGRPFANSARGLRRRLNGDLKVIGGETSVPAIMVTKVTSLVTPAPKPTKTRRTKKAKPEVAQEAAAVNAVMAASPSYDEGYRDAGKAFADESNDAYVISSLNDAHAFYSKRSAAPDASDYTKGMADGLTARLA
ncbi:MAG: hypothetical protein M3440_10420 [Chloroflexota bacterium]|nr:hypothetical protein [Chloroflexota bacterium]